MEFDQKHNHEIKWYDVAKKLMKQKGIKQKNVSDALVNQRHLYQQIP